jgi:hypothetical protein
MLQQNNSIFDNQLALTNSYIFLNTTDIVDLDATG